MGLFIIPPLEPLEVFPTCLSLSTKDLYFMWDIQEWRDFPCWLGLFSFLISLWLVLIILSMKEDFPTKSTFPIVSISALFSSSKTVYQDLWWDYLPKFEFQLMPYLISPSRNFLRVISIHGPNGDSSNNSIIVCYFPFLALVGFGCLLV